MTMKYQSKTLVPIKIIATGVALLPNKLEATELDKKLNKPVGYSLKRPGILYCYHANHQLQQADLAVRAIDDALIA
ncbi:hypothetical protein A9G48_01610 [Gilliamella sp. wkB18]|uniref:hypothetical protein n=1 Tax=Gilliamella sp. wkB18 TaxID=3120260 RepID=UPI0004DD6E07|nr:hypothetical protein [Gilliamella apicola]KFA58412.1 3-Oxoacyl-(acyl-carrier-protein (ACP)) synthase III C terminal [Gilliamella apicola]OCG64720.1 hypothetical protein A9G48_01610 [Gilliamella apicola]